MRARIAVTVASCLALILTACSGSPPKSDDPKLPSLPPSQAAQDLPAEASTADRIDAALAAGEIDESIAAMYRVWATFADPALPPEFDSEHSGIDTYTIATIGASLDEYSPEVRAELESFFTRPSDPGSAFSTPDTVITSAAAVDHSAAVTVATEALRAPSEIEPANESAPTDDLAPTTDPAEEDPKRCANWETVAVPDLPFRVWACADGLDAQAAITALTELLQKNAGDMIVEFPNGMGAPIPDMPEGEFAPDELIDFYVLPHGWMAPKRGLNERVADETLAGVAMAADPMDEHTSSSYLLIASYLLEHPEALERVVVHELFHALQYAHYRDISLENRWFYEATGFWSERYFTAQDPTHAYFYRISEMQNSPLGLADTDFQHAYSAFIWFTFLQQQQGPEAVFSFWENLREHPPRNTDPFPTSAFGAGFSVEDELPEFAMRLLNVKLPGDPISPRFADFDPGFPDDSTPNLAPVSFDGHDLALDGQGIPELGYRYTLVSFARETPVTMSHDLSTGSGVQSVVEALIPGSDGAYERVRLGTEFQDFCLSGDVYFVLSNPSTILDDATSGLVDLALVESSECGDLPGEPQPENPSLESPAPSDAPEPAPSSAPVDPPAERGYCPDMTWFESQMIDLVENPRPLTEEDVARIFSVTEPYLLNLPDGGQEHIDKLHQHSKKFIGVSDAETYDLAADEDFTNKVSWLWFLLQAC